MTTEVEIFYQNTVLERLPITEQTIIEIISPGPQGLQGVPGSGGGDVTLAVLAAENLPAYTLVTAQGNIANSSNTAHYGKVVGITTQVVLSGFIANLVADTEVTNNLWSWSPGAKLFLNGTTLSSTPPATGFCQSVAVARNANIIIVKLETPFLL